MKTFVGHLQSHKISDYPKLRETFREKKSAILEMGVTETQKIYVEKFYRSKFRL